jgi:hypothetical protein
VVSGCAALLMRAASALVREQWTWSRGAPSLPSSRIRCGGGVGYLSPVPSPLPTLLLVIRKLGRQWPGVTVALWGVVYRGSTGLEGLVDRESRWETHRCAPLDN